MGNKAGAFCGGSVCPKAGQGGDNEIFDDSNTCDPAGAVFQETLEDLNEVDRLLLTFCSSSNLAAVRWLFVLGANFDACDTNGTTALHAACRSGSLTIVRELLNRDLPMNATDVAGWTALHVAFFMGRRSVAVQLMRSGADLTVRNLKGLAPADLTSDVWLREAIIACAAHRRLRGLDTPWRYAREADLGEDVEVASRLRFEPFFVPRAAVLRDLQGCPELLAIGVEIFKQRPGQGLAFLVATGAVRDFPVELSSFMLEQNVSPVQVGEYLGEDFSLSQTLRLEFINSVRLTGTGVVTCLAKVFKQFTIPSDLHKIDRLVEGVAQIWWRQHEQIKELPQSMVETEHSTEDSGEVEGMTLMNQLGGYGVLHQLMLSTILLHWNLYAPLPPSQRITPSQWLQLNEDLGADGPEDPCGANHSMMKHVQILIYNLVSHAFFPQLQIWSRAGMGLNDALGSLSQEGTFEAPQGPGKDTDGHEGWALLVGGSFPTLAGSSGTVTYRHIRSILSEATSTTLSLASPATSRSSRPHDAPPDHDAVGAGLPPSVTYRHPGLGGASQDNVVVSESKQPVAAGGGTTDRVWLALRRSLLFLAPKPSNWAPYALIHLQGVSVQSVDEAALTLSLAMSRSSASKNPENQRLPEPPAKNEGSPLDPVGPQLQLIFLLPDGRWQVLDIPYLQVQLPDKQQLEIWRRSLEEHCSWTEPGGTYASQGSSSHLVAEREASSTGGLHV